MKKKWIAFLMAIGILILSGTALADEYAIVTNGQLNLRQQATSSSPSLGRYSGGTWIRILGMQNNGWLPVATPNGKTGYMVVLPQASLQRNSRKSSKPPVFTCNVTKHYPLAVLML